MDELTLHDLVQMTIANGDKYCAIDHDNRVCSFINKPTFDTTGQYWLSHTGNWHHIGYYYKPTCHWKDTLINIDNITLRNVQ